MTERLDALTVRESNGKSYWTKIGAAFASKGGGWIVRLDAMPAPVEGQFSIHLREPLPKDGDNPRGRSAAADRQQAGQRARNDDLGDDGDFDPSIPF